MSTSFTHFQQIEPQIQYHFQQPLAFQLIVIYNDFLDKFLHLYCLYHKISVIVPQFTQMSVIFGNLPRSFLFDILRI